MDTGRQKNVGTTNQKIEITRKAVMDPQAPIGNTGHICMHAHAHINTHTKCPIHYFSQGVITYIRNFRSMQ